MKIVPKKLDSLFTLNQEGKEVRIKLLSPEAWNKEKNKLRHASYQGFQGKKSDHAFVLNNDDDLDCILCGYEDGIDAYTLSHLPALLKKADLNPDGVFFKLENTENYSKDELGRLYLSWSLGHYKYQNFKEEGAGPQYKILLEDNDSLTKVKSLSESAYLLRDMINTPANEFGPDEIANTVKAVSDMFSAKYNVTEKAGLEKNFPLVHAVGKASSVGPRVAEIEWGDKSNPKLALVGKGVSFDTGGLNLKPGQHMALMKKDMGGAAHALAIAYIIMSLDLPVHLHLVIPTVENAVAGNAFRPGDVYKSRKGLTVENTNTDAEGRLILADALTFASEAEPDLLIDFATLTGSARAALGQVIPPFFATNEAEGDKLEKLSFENFDPLWRMPLYKPYKSLIKSDIADLVNSASPPGGLIYSALFLNSFVGDKVEWMHFDTFAWEASGKPGRPKGGVETGLFSVFKYISKRYAA